MSKRLQNMLCAAAAVVGGWAYAGPSELDAQTPVVRALVVRVDAEGNREVFKSKAVEKVDSEEAAKALATEAVKPEHKLVVSSGHELDGNSSETSWCYWYSPRYSHYYPYTFTHYWGAYGYNYYPYASYSWGGYRFFYYWWY